MAILIAVALSWVCAIAKDSILQDIPLEETAPKDSLTVSLITCYPGSEIYELCGHSALRIRGEGIDSVWNYGLFDFTEPNFVYRFVKGETDYMVAGYPFKWFLPEYQRDSRKVIEQDLNLTPQEVALLRKNLQIASLPENARYRYNYVKDNCSTRIVEQMDSATTEIIIFPDSVKYGTFRNEMRAFHGNYPWYQFGIDVALGSGLDYKLNSREELFVPVVLMERAAGARLSDGRPLVKETRVLNEGSSDAVSPPTHWALAPFFWSWVAALAAIGVFFYELSRGRCLRTFYFIWFLVLGLAGLLVFFLVFVSVHEATSPNALILWLNPLQFIMAFSIYGRRGNLWATFMSWYNFVVVGVLLIVWPFMQQSGNPAFFPLMGATALLGCGYAIIARKSSYNNDRDTRKRNVWRKKK